MSNWSHVSSVIRIDAFRFDDELPDFDSLIGKELNYHDPTEKWEDAEKFPNEYLPMGSEGSLCKSIWINPDVSCLAAYTVTIFGDLRNHDDPDEIITWFKELCSKLSVRDAIIKVANEVNGTRTWVYTDEED